ncbi:phosphoserine phosphatase isoform X3 [Cetorhinus maximus]
MKLLPALEACTPRGNLQSNMSTRAETKAVLRSADAVCFDVDSTVIKEEGIDELAKFCGVGDDVAEMTRNAMGGAVPFKKALTERLALIRPSREQVNKLITDHPPYLTEDIKDLVDRLQQRGVQVFLISGGFKSIVEHVAARINVPLSNVYANKLKFYFNGDYAGFDETQPTAESGGKGQIISLLKEERGFEKDAFIGFGGNIVRQQVKEKAKWFVTSFKEIIEELEN